MTDDGVDEFLKLSRSSGDERRRLIDTLVQKNEGLVRHFVKRSMTIDSHSGGWLVGYEDDLLQECRIGLADAIDKYDVNLGWRFSTFAWYHFRSAKKRVLRMAVQYAEIDDSGIEFDAFEHPNMESVDENRMISNILSLVANDKDHFEENEKSPYSRRTALLSALNNTAGSTTSNFQDRAFSPNCLSRRRAIIRRYHRT